MIKIEIKPLSVNQAWRGRRFKTPEYTKWANDTILLLPSKIDIPEGDFGIYLEWGLSSKNADWDNPIKTFVDVLQKKYNFNDNRIAFAFVRKVKVKKGNEYVAFAIAKTKKKLIEKIVQNIW